jgi:hypothetical protein
MDALDECEEEMRTVRNNHNEWKEERKKPPSPKLKETSFVDHLKPLILLSLSTG